MSQTFCFLLLPGFSALGFISAVEPLRVANRFRADAYRWQLLSLDGEPVQASNGMSVNVDSGLQRPSAGDALLVVAGFDPLAHCSSMLLSWLRRLDREGVVLGGLDTGAFVLAEAGLLDGHQTTLHWEALDAFRERYPHLRASQELFETDAGRITCAGGTASIDLMLELISRQHGSELVVQVSEQFVLGSIRPQKERQRLQVASRYGVTNRKLARVITEMERHTEPPLSSEALAACVQVSTRQLERLFSEHLGQTPLSFYLGLRLDKARLLLQQSDLSVLQVALACGFESASYFSRAYQRRFAVRPSRDRLSHATAARSAEREAVQRQ